MLRVMSATVVACVVMVANVAQAQDVERAPAPAWVLSPPADSPSAATNDVALRVRAIDHQTRFDADGSHNYVFQRFQVLTRQGLSNVGTVSLSWSPDSEKVQVHSLRIVRDGQVTDVLAAQQFETIRRENNLEDAMLDGRLTATLQPRDLRVGDVLELSYTVHDTHGVLAPHVESFDSPGYSQLDRFRLRATWSPDHPVRVAASSPWAEVQPRREGDLWVYEINEADLKPERIPDDLPVRLGLLRTIQFTDYADWADASRMMAPLYEKASTLEPDSPLLAEVARIRRAERTQAGRAMAALRLVEDNVRYLALSMGSGNYVPASADDVWRSRYGDCKGKTVLLLALLNALDIEAEPALVSTEYGDGLDGQLPLMGWFDHVIVRAVVDGQTYWMDGTRIGDRTLSGLTPPAYVWALPVRTEGAALTPIEQRPLTTPISIVTMDVDARQGLDADAPMTMDIAYYGDSALSMRRQLGAIPPEQLETMMKARFGEDDQTTINTVTTRYDEAANALHLILTGATRLSWIEGTAGRVLAFDESGLALATSEERKGVLAAYKDAPYAINHPLMTRVETRLRLPQGGRGFQLEGGDQVLEGAGYRFERTGVLQGDLAKVAVTTTSLVREVSAADMEAARKRTESAAALPMRLRAPATYAATAADRNRTAAGADDADALMARARRLNGGGDTAGALALLDVAVTREPENAELLRLRGATRVETKDYDGGRADFEQALEVDPADQKAMAALSWVDVRQARYADAVRNATAALRLDPSDQFALGLRAASYYQLGRFDRALPDYRALKAQSPDRDGYAVGEISTLIHLDRLDEARALMTARLEKDPTDGAVFGAMDRLMKRGVATPADLAAVDQAIAVGGEGTTLLALRGGLKARAGDDAGARADFAALRSVAHGEPVLLNNLCWAQAVAGFDMDQALIDCDGAMAAGEAAYVDSRAMVLLNLGRHAEAQADYERAIAAAPTQAPSIFGLGLARLAQGDAGGRDDLSRARAIDVDVAEDFSVFLERHPELAGS